VIKRTLSGIASLSDSCEQPPQKKLEAVIMKKIETSFGILYDMPLTI